MASWYALTEGARTLWTDFKNFFSKLFTDLLEWFIVDLPAKFSQLGTMIIDGLIKGVISKYTAPPRCKPSPACPPSSPPSARWPCPPPAPPRPSAWPAAQSRSI
jgi:hypothetical protein